MKLQRTSRITTQDRDLATETGEWHIRRRGGGFRISTTATAELATELTVWVEVDPSGLSSKSGGQHFDDTPPIRGIHVPECEPLIDLQTSVLRVLSFSVGSELSAHGIGFRPELIAESETDQRCLDALENLPVWVDTWLSFRPRPPTIEGLDEEALDRLLDREIGIAIYSDARRMTSALGSFREFWRVLESAFGRKDDALVALVVAYPPAADLEFDTTELQKSSYFGGVRVTPRVPPG